MLPDADELAEVLLDLGVPHQDIDESVRLSRRVTDDADALRFLEETVAGLVQGMGGITPSRRPASPSGPAIWAWGCTCPTSWDR